MKKYITIILFLFSSFVYGQTNDTVCIIMHVGIQDKPIFTMVLSRNKVRDTDVGKISKDSMMRDMLFESDFIETGNTFNYILNYVNTTKYKSDRASAGSNYGTFKVIVSCGYNTIESYYVKSTVSRFYFTDLTGNCCGTGPQSCDLIKYLLNYMLRLY